MDLIDIGVGLIALFLTIVVSLFLGGFSFIEPWLLFGSVFLFLAGTLRGRQLYERTWWTVFSLNLPWLILLPTVVRGAWRWVLINDRHQCSNLRWRVRNTFVRREKFEKNWPNHVSHGPRTHDEL